MLYSNQQTEGYTDETKNETKTCSGRTKDKCPLNGKCLQKSLVYQATVSTDADTYRYIGLTEQSFKQRFTNHNQSFRHEKYSNSTELSKLIWKLRTQKLTTISHGKSSKAPFRITSAVQNVTYVSPRNFTSLRPVTLS